MASRSIALCAALALLSFHQEVAAQLPVSVETRAGVAIPVADFGRPASGFSAEAGPTFAASVSVHPTDFLGFYLGYQQVRFGCERCAAVGLDGTDFDFSLFADHSLHVTAAAVDLGLSFRL